MKKTAFGFGPAPGQPIPGQHHINIQRSPAMTQELTFAEQAKRTIPVTQSATIKRPTDIVLNRLIPNQTGKNVFHHMMTTKNPSVAHVRADMVASKMLDPMKRLGSLIPKAIKIGYLRGKEAAFRKYLGESIIVLA